jgi:hypothetical protein
MERSIVFFSQIILLCLNFVDILESYQMERSIVFFSQIILRI